MTSTKTPQSRVLELVSWEDANGFATVDLVKERYNCEAAEVDPDGDIWIGGPQWGNWLDDEEIEQFLAWVEFRNQ